MQHVSKSKLNKRMEISPAHHLRSVLELRNQFVFHFATMAQYLDDV